MSLARTMSFGQGKVTTSRRVLARRGPLYFLLSFSGYGESGELPAGSLRIYRYELDQRNSCEKNMLLPPNPFSAVRVGILTEAAPPCLATRSPS